MPSTVKINATITIPSSIPVLPIVVWLIALQR